MYTVHQKAYRLWCRLAPHQASVESVRHQPYIPIREWYPLLSLLPWNNLISFSQVGTFSKLDIEPFKYLDIFHKHFGRLMGRLSKPQPGPDLNSPRHHPCWEYSVFVRRWAVLTEMGITTRKCNCSYHGSKGNAYLK